jgi:hypothetical protein
LTTIITALNVVDGDQETLIVLLQWRITKESS